MNDVARAAGLDTLGSSCVATPAVALLTAGRVRAVRTLAEDTLSNLVGFYIGGMGAKEQNFHKDLICRMGYESEANRIQELFLEGRRAEAVAAVPDALADAVSLVGPRERIRDRLAAWRASRVTTLLAAGSRDSLRTLAELVL